MRKFSIIIAVCIFLFTAASSQALTLKTQKVGSFGTILVDGRGMPLYIFTADKGKKSKCYGACAKAWPITYSGKKPKARGGAKQSLIGKTRRSDGTSQVTYRGRPLYYYKDDRPGLALCHNVREFGGLWLLIKGNGKIVAK